MLQVVREVVVASASTDVTGAMTVAETIAGSEDQAWLARAEAAQLLAHHGRLDHDLLSRLWAGAPVAVHADLAAAVAVAVRSADPPPAWAEAFLDSLAAEPMLQVVLTRTREKRSSTGTPSVPTTTGPAVADSGDPA